jgi:DUF2970 family protein
MVSATNLRLGTPGRVMLVYELGRFDATQMPPQPPTPSTEDTKPPSASFPRVMGVVFSSFLGIRKRSQGERDAVTVKPIHVILAGVLAAAIFVAILITLVRLITRGV